MAKQINTPKEWRLLAERDFSVAEHLSIINHFSVQPRYDFGLSLSDEDMHLVLAQTKTIKDFLIKEIPTLFKDD